MFDTLWKIYPNGGKKQMAIEAWEKLKPDDEVEEQIRVALRWQRKSDSWKEENGKYVPMLSTYLNQQRWTDKEIQPSTPRATL